MPNNLTEVTPKLLAQGLLALREQCAMPRLVNRQYEALAGQKGSTIDVPIPSAIAARAVTPGVTMTQGVDSAPTSVPIALDQWWEAPFHMSDKDVLTAMEGTLPMQASEAIKSLANSVNGYLLGLYTKVYGAAGTAGTTPFASNIDAYISARRLLNTQLAPMTDRRVILDPAAEGNALKLGIFLQADQRGDQGGVIQGSIGTKIGADWFLDQSVPTHTAGVATALSTAAAVTAGATSVSATILPANTADVLVEGDIITFAGDTQQYVVGANVTTTAATETNATITISPAKAVAASSGVTITKLASHTVNMLFHRDAFAFATRPLASVGGGLGNQIMSMVDEVSGLTLRLEISRQYKQTMFSYDILFGAACIRPELATRILG